MTHKQSYCVKLALRPRAHAKVSFVELTMVHIPTYLFYVGVIVSFVVGFPTRRWLREL